MYSVQIRDNRDHRVWKFYTIKQEIFKEVPTTVTDEDTGETTETITKIPTGTYETVRYLTDSKDELESTYMSLLDKYPRSFLLPISIPDYVLDMVFPDDAGNIPSNPVDPEHPSEEGDTPITEF